MYISIVIGDLLKARICDIFYNMFHCVQLGYKTNKQTYLFRDIFVTK